MGRKPPEYCPQLCGYGRDRFGRPCAVIPRRKRRFWRNRGDGFQNTVELSVPVSRFRSYLLALTSNPPRVPQMPHKIVDRCSKLTQAQTKPDPPLSQSDFPQPDVCAMGIAKTNHAGDLAHRKFVVKRLCQTLCAKHARCVVRGCSMPELKWIKNLTCCQSRSAQNCAVNWSMKGLRRCIFTP